MTNQDLINTLKSRGFTRTAFQTVDADDLYVLNDGDDNMIGVYFAPTFADEKYAVVYGLPAFETLATNLPEEILPLIRQLQK